MVVDTKRRMMMISKRKKSPAERLLELSKRRLERESIFNQSASISTVKPEYLNIPDFSFRAKKQKEALRHQRKRAIKGAEDIISGKLPDSSWIRVLEFIPTDGDVGKVHADFTKRWYTFLNVPETLFNAWYAGAAATTTSDASKARRWNLHDFPSLGAFFNQRIRGKFSFYRGRY